MKSLSDTIYISCPRCATNFLVTPAQIGLNGRKVKCSKCTNIWHQKLPDNYFDNPNAFLQKQNPVKTDVRVTENYNSVKRPGVNLPALLPILIPKYLYILPTIFLFLTILIYLFLYQDTSIWTDSVPKAISIADVKVISKKEDGKISLTYKITNQSNKKLDMPLIRIRFMNNEGVISAYVLNKNEIGTFYLLPKQDINIKTEFANISKDATKLDIRLGSKFRFMLW